MRIALLGVQVPFVRGGAEALLEALRGELVAAGHEVDVVTLPFNDSSPGALLASCLAWRTLDLQDLPLRPVDRVIATKFPSYWIRHPDKVVWLVHQHRALYDLASTPFTHVYPDRLPDAVLRGALVEMDTRTLAECRRRFTISRTVSERLRRFNDLESEALYHPPRLAGRLAARDYGDFVLAVSRLESHKRVDLLLEALRYTKSGVRVVIAGEGVQEKHLRHIVARDALDARVTFAGAADDAALVDLYARCRAVFFAPYEEDYGYVTLEALLAGKPVLTANDSGGVLEFVEDGVTGLVTQAVPEAVASALDRLAAEEGLARRLGEAGRRRVEGVGWRQVIDALGESR